MIWIAALLALQDPEIEIDRDNLAVEKSCRVTPGVYTVEDKDGNGVLHVKADGVTIDFQGATLRGAEEKADRESLTGIGISVAGRRNVTIRNARVHGYQFNIRVSDSEHVTVERCDVSLGRAQRILHGGKRLEHWLVLRDLEAWRSYGAAIWIEKGRSCRVVRCTGRHAQNGVLLAGSSRCEILQNDFCFNSGWGIGLWESCDNHVNSNLADFVNRPWGGGWGGDSAALVVVNASHRNRIIGNSLTHGGDGFFLTNRADVGNPADGPCNDNLVAYNDGSCSTANAFEATFSDGNLFVGNLANKSGYGFWCGFSNQSLYAGNQICDNKAAGIATEHGHDHWIEGNEISRNGVGVQFWHDPDRRYPSHDQTIRNNRFVGNGRGVEVRQTDGLSLEHNEFRDNGRAVVLEQVTSARATGNRFVIEKSGEGFVTGNLDARGNAWSPDPGPLCTGRVDTSEPDPDAGPVVMYKDRGLPSGWEMLRPAAWAPEDFTHALVYPQTIAGGRQAELCLVGRGPFALDGVPEGVEVSAKEGTAPARVTISARETTQFTLTVVFAGLKRTERVEVTLVPTTWTVRFYGWDSGKSPPADVFDGTVLDETTVEAIDFVWGGRGPSAKVPADRFAVRATTEADLPAGEYEIHTVSDDGVRVRIDGNVVFEDWTWHPPRAGSVRVTLAKGRHEIVVEHFEIDGHAQLQVSLEPK